MFEGILLLFGGRAAAHASAELSFLFFRFGVSLVSVVVCRFNKRVSDDTHRPCISNSDTEAELRIPSIFVLITSATMIALVTALPVAVKLIWEAGLVERKRWQWAIY